jgi:hypothetical protein
LCADSLVSIILMFGGGVNVNVPSLDTVPWHWSRTKHLMWLSSRWLLLNLQLQHWNVKECTSVPGQDHRTTTQMVVGGESGTKGLQMDNWHCHCLDWKLCLLAWGEACKLRKGDKKTEHILRATGRWAS